MVGRSKGITRLQVIEAVREHGSQRKAAKALGVAPSFIYRKLPHDHETRRPETRSSVRREKAVERYPYPPLRLEDFIESRHPVLDHARNPETTLFGEGAWFSYVRYAPPGLSSTSLYAWLCKNVPIEDQGDINGHIGCHPRLTLRNVLRYLRGKENDDVDDD